MANNFDNLVNKSPYITPNSLLSGNSIALIIDTLGTWKLFLEEIKNWGVFLQNSFYYNEEDGTLFGYLSNQVDLDISNTNSSIDTSIEFPFLYYVYDDNVNFWNESIDNTITDFIKNTWSEQGSNTEELQWGLNSVNVNGYITFKNSSNNVTNTMRVQDIKEADAARAFVNLPTSNETSYVIPWYNIDWETYQKVRKTNDGDGVTSVLASKRNLQFTRSQEHLDYWLRLIMPKYTRRVEIEDLNRNFWVISSVLGGISGYLFSDDSPLVKVLKRILDEIIQIWNNLLYLWLAAGIEANKAINTHIEIVPINVTDNWCSRKFDNFDLNSSSISSSNYQEIIGDKLDYLLQKYSNSNLVVFPQFRLKNYSHNYYKEEIYPAVYWCNRLRGDYEFQSKSLLNTTRAYFNIDETLKPFSFPIKERLLGYRDGGSGYYVFHTLSDVKNIKTKDQIYIYFGVARILPDIEVNFTREKSELKTLTFDVQDAVKTLYSGKQTSLGNLSLTKTYELTSSEKIEFKRTEEDFNKDEIANASAFVLDKVRQIYLGEVLSTPQLTNCYIILNIHNVEADDNSYLSDFKLQLETSNGIIYSESGTKLSSTQTWTTENSEKTFQLTNGSYTLSEISVSDSSLYKKISPISFEVNYGSITKQSYEEDSGSSWKIKTSANNNSIIIYNKEQS